MTEKEYDETKSILMSIKPQWVEKILNGEKTIEIRKRFPKDFVGWVYIYCTKAKPYLHEFCQTNGNHGYMCIEEKCGNTINGKVVAKFWCNKVEKIETHKKIVYKTAQLSYETESMKEWKLLKKSRLSLKELDGYLKKNEGYAIHISDLEIFEKPDELHTTAPQSWKYL